MKNTDNYPMIAKTFAGLEEVLARELLALGATNVQMLKRAVSFEGDTGFMYKANLCCRTALKILMPIAKFKAENEDQLYTNINKMNWDEWLDKEGTFYVDTVVSFSNITHSKYASLKVKDAIVDRYRHKYGERPSIDPVRPSLRINIHISKNECSVSLDSSGESLHKRGYKKHTEIAPLNEVLAAGMIMLSGWNRNCNFIDPMCGSGTLLIEAALYANNIPAGIYRKDFSFMHWQNFDQKLWNMIVDSSVKKQTEFDYKIIGSDISIKSVGIAKENIQFAKLHKDISVKQCPFEKYEPMEERGILVTNPPYGERISLEDKLEFYKMMGDTLKKNFNNHDAWIISSDIEALKNVGLKPTRRITLFNGALECKFMKFEVYSGSKKTH